MSASTHRNSRIISQQNSHEGAGATRPFMRIPHFPLPIWVYRTFFTLHFAFLIYMASTRPSMRTQYILPPPFSFLLTVYCLPLTTYSLLLSPSSLPLYRLPLTAYRSLNTKYWIPFKSSNVEILYRNSIMVYYPILLIFDKWWFFNYIS